VKGVILAGGKGTRLHELTRETPKPLLEVEGKPVLEYQIENFSRYGIRQFILVIGHLGHQIKEYFGDGSKWGVSIEYFEERFPLGTAGSFYYLKEFLPEEFFVSYGDLIFDLDFDRFISFHKTHRGMCTLMVHPNDHPLDCDVMVVDRDHVIRKILRKNEDRAGDYPNCVNAAVFLLNRRLLGCLLPNKKQDLERDVIEPAISQGEIIAYKSSEYLKDMGTPERFQLVRNHVSKGIPSKRNLQNKQKAIFVELDMLDFEGSYETFKGINGSEFLLIAMVRQAGREHMIETDLGNRGAYVDGIYSDVHLLDRLVEMAAQDFNVDLARSYFIGRKESLARTDLKKPESNENFLNMIERILTGEMK